MKIELGILITLVIVSFSGCSTKISNIPEKTSSEIAQEQGILDKEVQDEKKDVTESIIQETDNEGYEIYFEKFIVKNEDKQTDIIIEYPQFKSIKSLDLQKKVNKLLSEKAISDYEDEDVDGLSLSLKTEVEYANSNIISVKYTGFAYYVGTANGYDILYATNINMKAGEIIDIHNIFTDSFEHKLTRNVFTYNGADRAENDDVIAPNSNVYGYVNADESIIVDMFDNFYSNKVTDTYYFSENYFHIIVKTPSRPTMYLELAAYPKNIFYTTNIDINKEKRLKLTDLVSINEDFIEKFKGGKHIAWDTELSSATDLIKEDIGGYNLLMNSII